MKIDCNKLTFIVQFLFFILDIFPFHFCKYAIWIILWNPWGIYAFCDEQMNYEGQKASEAFFQWFYEGQSCHKYTALSLMKDKFK